MIKRLKNSGDYLREIFRKPDHMKSRFRYGDILFFLKFAKPVWKLGAICTVLMLITSGLSALVPLSSKVLIDFIILKEGFDKVEALLRSVHLEQLIGPAEYFLGSLELLLMTALALGIIMGVTGLIQKYLSFRFQQESVFNMQTVLFDHLLSFPLTFFKKRQTGYLMSRVSDDINRLQMLFSYSIPQITNTVFYLTFGITILFTLNIKLSLILISVAPFYVLINYFFAGRLRSVSWSDMEKSARVSGNLQEAISGIELIKSFAAEKRELGKVSSALRNVMRTRMKHTILSSISNYSMSGTRLLLTLLIVWLGVHEKTKGTMTVGDFIAFITYVLFLSSSMNRLSSFFITMQPVFASMHRVIEIFRMIPEFDSNNKSGALIRPEKIAGEIEFRNVSFAYEENRPALTDISFRACPGDIVAVVGHSGAGKTTLVNLLLKFYLPSSGSILLDGIDLEDIDPAWLRRRTGVVSQETFLFNDTVENNIKYGRPSATKEEVTAAAQKAHIHNDIESLPDKYDTVIGERGSTLSTGQKQRISMARAFLKDPVILILDEPTSALDAETEGLIKDSINELVKGRTTFIISHRTSVIESAHKVLVLDKGRLAATPVESAC